MHWCQPRVQDHQPGNNIFFTYPSATPLVRDQRGLISHPIRLETQACPPTDLHNHPTRISSAAMTFPNPTMPSIRHLPVLPTLLQKVPILPQVKVPKPPFRNFQLLTFRSRTLNPKLPPIFSTRVPTTVIPTPTRLQHKFRSTCYQLHLLIATRSIHTAHHPSWHATCPLYQKQPRHPCSYLTAEKQSSLSKRAY